ncbi:hypothetical protein AAE478_005908 [Parahypoxylon ruwenzoriense]
MGTTTQYHGSLVAFEGCQDAISTQLRLLPNSPKILLIPPFRYFMKENNLAIPFDARSHILMVHKACSERVEIARSFLRDSTPSNKRLVFMNGGTAGAQTECISSISKHLTHGDFARAERIFNELIRNGVAGLRSRRKVGADSGSTQPTGANRRPSEQVEEVPSDPASKAMRAADALDFETASLQSNNEIDLTTTTRPRSHSVPIHPMADDFQNAAPFYVFGVSRSRRITRDFDVPLSPRSRPSQDPRMVTQRALNPAESQVDGLNSQPDSPNCTGGECATKELSPASADLASPHSFGFVSTPTTPAMICEAFAVDVRASVASHKRAKSVDRVYTGAVHNKDISLSNFPRPPRSKPSALDDGPPSALEYEENSTPRPRFPSEIPRPTFGTPSRTMIRRSPPSPLKLRKPSQRPASYVDRSTSPRHSYVDQSTTTEQIHVDRGADTEPHVFLGLEDDFEIDPHAPFESVLPMLEDLVIHFKGEDIDSRLGSTIQAFREGIYPKSTPPLGSKAGRDRNQLSTRSSRESKGTLLDQKALVSDVQHADAIPIYRLDTDEYNPFANGGRFRPSYTWSPRQTANSYRPFTPPTPAQTPPPIRKRPEKFFHEFVTTGCRTAVCTQNALRSILNIYFPPEDAGYHQFTFPLLPELSSLWKPVFRELDSGTVIKRKRKVDLILAIGAQKGVNREFLGAISGSLEKLGTKPNGVTRSGRLDLRFLIANVMQAFTSQPLANQTQDNPFSNPLLLATLIIPHLEMYMAAHSATRFLLLEYPPEHLATVLALQRLVGVDLLKVAGILDSEASDPKPYPGFRAPRRTNAHTPSNSGSGLTAANKRAGATLLAPSGVKQTETVSFSKANFLLTSLANESEIATLISTIWKILIDISTFYIPEGVAPRSSVQIDRESKRDARRESQGKPLVHTPLINPVQQYAPLAHATALLGFQKHTGDTSSTYVLNGIYTETNSPPTPSKHATRRELPLKSPKGSISETIRTVKTMRSQRKKPKNILGKEVGADNAATVPPDAVSAYDSWDDDDEGGFSAEERKYMPLYGKQDAPRKGNSRKALKWLGLAT